MQRDRWLLSAALASALIFTALAVPAVDGRFWSVDYGVKALMGGVQQPWLGTGMRAVSILGDPAGLLVLIALLSGAAWCHCRRYAAMVPLVMLGAGILQYLAKWAVDRPRPNHSPWGFPSGHVLSVVVLLGLACHLVVAADLGRRWQRRSAGLAFAVVLAVAASRLYLDMHWLSDVAGGFAIGLAYLLVVVPAIRLITPGRARALIEAPEAFAADGDESLSAATR